MGKLLRYQKAIHFTGDVNFELDKDRVYVQDPNITTCKFTKPIGLWVSFEENRNGWFGWCIQEDFRVQNLNYHVQLDLSNLNLLVIESSSDIEQFNKRYVVNGIPKWSDIIQKYDGIIIPNYLYEYRYKYSWYYGWDCDSGSIWNLKNISHSTVKNTVVNTTCKQDGVINVRYLPDESW
jgi:hypothetical protein